MEALGQSGRFDAMLDAALQRRTDAETWGEEGYLLNPEASVGPEQPDVYATALERARRELGLPQDDDKDGRRACAASETGQAIRVDDGTLGELPTMSMRELRADEIRGLAPQLLELQHAAYAVEAALIGDDRIPPLHETESDLVSAGLEWIASFDDERIAGAVGYSIDDEVVDIDRLMISPRYHRKGLGTALVTRVISLAPKAVVATGRANGPARALYERVGFLHDSDIEPTPGLWVSCYSRTAPPLSAADL